MKNTRIFSVIGSIMYPFLIIFGFYIVINGDITPGGGFQGGVIFATAFFIRYLLNNKDPFDLKLLARFEKLIYLLILIYISLSWFTKGEIFTNFINSEFVWIKRLFLVALNVFIGLKVTVAVISIISSFIEEGEL